MGTAGAIAFNANDLPDTLQSLSAQLVTIAEADQTGGTAKLIPVIAKIFEVGSGTTLLTSDASFSELGEQFQPLFTAAADAVSNNGSFDATIVTEALNGVGRTDPVGPTPAETWSQDICTAEELTAGDALDTCLDGDELNINGNEYVSTAIGSWFDAVQDGIDSVDNLVPINVAESGLDAGVLETLASLLMNDINGAIASNQSITVEDLF